MDGSKANPVTALSKFLDARRFTRDQVLTEPCPVPNEPGVYAWWFRQLPGDFDASGCERRGDLTLLYVGISPTPPPTNGKPPSTQDLRKRIRYHFGAGRADAEGSTLRKTLGVLMAKELGTELRRVGSGKRRTFAGGEAMLNQWMADNVEVSWVVRPEPWVFEAELVAALDLPLNPHGSGHEAFRLHVKALLRDAMKKADKQRVLAEW